MAAQGDIDDFVLRAKLLIDVFSKGLTAGKTGGALCHGGAVDVLATGGMAGDDGVPEIGKRLFVGQLAENLVDEIEAAEIVRAGGCASGTPAIAAATVTDLVRGEPILAAGTIAGDAGR